MHEELARLFAGLPDWVAVPEVTFSIYGERGAIDILAWHEPTRSLLVIELKTELVDIQETSGRSTARCGSPRRSPASAAGTG